jgi:plasmid stabilization system protein ParE
MNFRFHPEAETDIRRVLAHRFPYGVLYVPRGNSIIVLAVMHLRRQPDYWRERA